MLQIKCRLSGWSGVSGTVCNIKAQTLQTKNPSLESINSIAVIRRKLKGK